MLRFELQQSAQPIAAIDADADAATAGGLLGEPLAQLAPLLVAEGLDILYIIDISIILPVPRDYRFLSAGGSVCDIVACLHVAYPDV